MSGVTVLNTIPKYTMASWQIFLILFVIMIGALITFAQNNAHKRFISSIATLCTALIVSALFAVYPAHLDSVWYKIKVDDSVNFNEFMSKFEIIESYNDVYVVEEK